MTPENLATLIDLYGSAVDTWPDARRRAAARDLLARSETARTILERARGLERCLRPLDEDQVRSAVDDAACERLIALTLARAQRTPQRPPPPAVRIAGLIARAAELVGDGWWRYGLPATVALALGIAVGHATLDHSTYAQAQPNVEGLITSTHATEPFEL